MDTTTLPSDVPVTDSASASLTSVSQRSVRRIRLIALVAALSAVLALYASYSPWFRSTSRMAQASYSSAAGAACQKSGGIVVQNASGYSECAVWDATVSGRQLVEQSASAARAGGVTQNIAYKKLPSSTMGLPSPTFWALVAALLTIVAVAAHSVIAAIASPLCGLLAWGALSKFAAYAQDPAHGGAFVQQAYGVLLTKSSILLVSAMSLSGGLAVLKERRAVWQQRQAQGLPATAIATVIRGAVTRTLAEAARQMQDASSGKV